MKVLAINAHPKLVHSKYPDASSMSKTFQEIIQCQFAHAQVEIPWKLSIDPRRAEKAMLTWEKHI